MLEFYKKEIAPIDTPIQRGENTPRVRRVQEWINLHKWYTPRFNMKISIDGDFGGATESAVKAFQYASGLEATGVVDQRTWMALVAPMQRAFQEIIFIGNASLRERFVAYAEQFLHNHPVEIHSNHGPWVRVFMRGKEWDDAAWCAGSLCTILDLAVSSMNEDLNKILPYSWSVPELVQFAKNGKYITSYLEPSQVKVNPSLVKSGDLIIVIGPKGPSHIALVVKTEDAIAWTTEGNSNDEGSREGYEFCAGRRDLASGKYGVIKLN